MADLTSRWAVIESEIDAVQVTAENAREVAAWCGGWACDDLAWSDVMRCYRYPDDHPVWPGGLMAHVGGPTPGAVMMRYEWPVNPGDWVVLVRDNFGHLGNATFRSRYRPAV